MPAELAIVQGPQTGFIFRLEKDETSIGRSGCDIALADNMISRVHARILQRGVGYEIEDLGSRNGLYLNDAKILHARLVDGALITMGNIVLQFRCASTPPDSPPKDDAGAASSATHTITIDAHEPRMLIESADDQDPESLRRAKQDLEAIYRTNQALSTVLDPEQLINRLMDIILAEIPQVDICSLHLINEKTGALVYRQQRRRNATDSTETPAFSTSLIRIVLQERKAMLTYDAQQDARLHVQASIASLHIRSAMCVPLQSRSRLLGVLQANTVEKSHRFDRDDLKLLTALGAQAGSSLENALLYDKLATEKAALHQANEQLKKAQDGLVQSEKLAAVGRLTAGIVHDVKNPMTVILASAELLERHLKQQGVTLVGDMDIAGSLHAIQEGVLHCNAIIDRLLQFARQSPPAKFPLAVNDLVESTAAFLSHEMTKAKVHLEQRLAEDLPEVMADANQIRQVLLNILINAIQSLPADGGRIVIATAAEQVHEKRFVVCRIQDDGMGMTEEVKKRIFEPFFSTKTPKAGLGGTGLGLSVSYGIIQNHGGAIEVESKAGKGTTFSIALPVNAA